CAKLLAIKVVETRLTCIQAPVYAAIRCANDGAVGGQETVGGAATVTLKARQQGERGAGAEVKREAGRQVVALHVGMPLHTVFAPGLGHDAVIGSACFISNTVVVESHTKSCTVAGLGLQP